MQIKLLVVVDSLLQCYSECCYLDIWFCKGSFFWFIPNVQSSPTFLHAIPNSTTSTAIELHCLKERCGEEISLLTIEMHRLHKQMTILAMAFNSDGTEEAAKVTLGLNNFVSFQTGWIWKAAILLEMSQGRTRSHYSWITWNCFVLPRVSGHQHAWSG